MPMKHLAMTRLLGFSAVIALVVIGDIKSLAQDCKTLVPDDRDLTGYVCGGTLEAGIMNHNEVIGRVRAFIWKAYKTRINGVISLHTSSKEGEPADSTFYMGPMNGQYRIFWKSIYHPSDRRTGKRLPAQPSESIAASIKRYILGPGMYGSGGEYIPDDKPISSAKYVLEFVDENGKVNWRF